MTFKQQVISLQTSKLETVRSSLSKWFKSIRNGDFYLSKRFSFFTQSFCESSSFKLRKSRKSQPKRVAQVLSVWFKGLHFQANEKQNFSFGCQAVPNCRFALCCFEILSTLAESCWHTSFSFASIAALNQNLWPILKSVPISSYLVVLFRLFAH